MHDVYLKLSDVPPDAWAQVFEEAWHLRFYSMKRRARVEGEHIVIHCALEEIEPHHKPELLAVIAETNQRYRAFATQHAYREQLDAERQAAADRNKKDALDRLSFE